jgi:hypothetical protein
MSDLSDSLDNLMGALPITNMQSGAEACTAMMEVLRVLKWRRSAWSAQERRHLARTHYDLLEGMTRDADREDAKVAAFRKLAATPKKGPRIRVAGRHDRPRVEPPRWRPAPDAERTRHAVAEALADADLHVGELIRELRAGGVQSTKRAREHEREALASLYAATAILRTGGPTLIDEMRRRLDGGYS